METDLIQTSILAVIQGLTEFLPISSSAHLILPSQLFGWQDQGLAFDVAVHVGSLLAVLLYFRKDILLLITAWMQSLPAMLRHRESPLVSLDKSAAQHAQLAWCLLLASIPAALAGFYGRDFISAYARDAQVIAITSIGFGLLLWWADSQKPLQKSLDSISWRQGITIGIAQAFAIIPGTSRSGVTMTAALLLGFSRQAAARFSFLLAVPIIAGSGLLQGMDLLAEGIAIERWQLLAYATLLAALVAFLCIHFFLRLIERIGFMPFVIYRLMLGLLLLMASLA